MIGQWRGGVRGKGEAYMRGLGRRGKESGAEGVERRDAMVV